MEWNVSGFYVEEVDLLSVVARKGRGEIFGVLCVLCVVMKKETGIVLPLTPLPDQNHLMNTDRPYWKVISVQIYAVIQRCLLFRSERGNYVCVRPSPIYHYSLHMGGRLFMRRHAQHYAGRRGWCARPSMCGIMLKYTLRKRSIFVILLPLHTKIEKYRGGGIFPPSPAGETTATTAMRLRISPRGKAQSVCPTCEHEHGVIFFCYGLWISLCLYLRSVCCVTPHQQSKTQRKNKQKCQ